jgi:hypothetical protein
MEVYHHHSGSDCTRNHWDKTMSQTKETRDALLKAVRLCAAVNNFDNPMTAGDCADAIWALIEPECGTCNGNGMIGGPSFYAPDEGGEPCPDCSRPPAKLSIFVGFPATETQIKRLAMAGDPFYHAAIDHNNPAWWNCIAHGYRLAEQHLVALVASQDAQPALIPDGNLSFHAMRLRRACKLMGVMGLPEDDATLIGALGTVLGQFCQHVEQQAKPAPANPIYDARCPLADRTDWSAA